MKKIFFFIICMVYLNSHSQLPNSTTEVVQGDEHFVNQGNPASFIWGAHPEGYAEYIINYKTGSNIILYRANAKEHDVEIEVYDSQGIKVKFDYTVNSSSVRIRIKSVENYGSYVLWVRMIHPTQE